MTIVLVRPTRLDLDTFARAVALHPDVVRRLVALGLLDADADAEGRLWLPADQLARVGRIQRLRAGFALNYAAVGLVMDLLDRIAELEEATRGR
jgi:chaperone modulatory protein CbpM